MAMNTDAIGAKALVTGGAGFIGSHIVDALLKAGYEVTVIDDLSSGSLDQIPASVTFIQCDVVDRHVSDHIRVAQPDLVIHAAAQVSVNASVEDPERDRRVNLAGTENVLRGARDAGGRRFVFISSGGAVYGEAEGSTEADIPNPANPYGIHKLAAEGYVRSSGLQYAIARFANVYGPRQRSNLEGGVVSIFIEGLTRGAPITIFGSGDQARDFVYVSDVVDATLAIGRSDLVGTWNVSTGVPTSVRTLLTELEKLIVPAVEVKSAPPRPGDVAISSMSPAKIRRELGWSPRTPVFDGLKQTVMLRPDDVARLGHPNPAPSGRSPARDSYRPAQSGRPPGGLQ